MWVVFLLAAMGFAVATLLVIYIGNKVVNAMKKDDAKLDKDINKENTNEKEMYSWKCYQSRRNCRAILTRDVALL